METVKFGHEEFSIEVFPVEATKESSYFSLVMGDHRFVSDQSEHHGVVASGLQRFRVAQAVRNWSPFFDCGDSPQEIVNRFIDLLWRLDRSRIVHEGGVNMAMVEYQFDQCFDYRLGLPNDGTLFAVRCPIDRTETFAWTLDGQAYFKQEVSAKIVDQTIEELMSWLGSPT